MSISGEDVRKSKMLNFSFRYSPYNQTVIDSSVQAYPRLRDFYNLPHEFHLIIFFSNEIAKSINATLISNPFETDTISPDDWKNPTIIPFHSAGEPKMSSYDFWKTARNKTQNVNLKGKLPHFHKMDSIAQNFIYCDTPKRNKGSLISYISIFVNPFDKFTWLCMFLAFMLVTLVLRADYKASFLAISTMTFSILLSPVINGISAEKKMMLQHNKLLLLWMFCSTILVNMYCAVMTTNITSPLPEATMETIEDLLKAKYSVIYSQQRWLDSDKSIAILQNQSTFWKLLQLAVIAETDYMTELCCTNKRAYISGWNIALRDTRWAMEKSKEIMEKKSGTSSKLKQRECYVGKELFAVKYMSYGFLPPGNEQASLVFKRFFNSGIYRLCMGEYFAWTHSGRVQDRVKVVSRTKILTERDKEITAIGLNTKILAVLILWIACLVVSAVVFLFEKAGSTLASSHRFGCLDSKNLH